MSPDPSQLRGDEEAVNRRAAVVLAGGHSRRMGQAKAWISIDNEPLLTRILRILDGIVGERIVVSRRAQDLPPLPTNVRHITDRFPDRGPLEGLGAGLAACSPKIRAVFVCSCDLPLLNRESIASLFAALRPEDEAVVPLDQAHRQPLAAVYRPSVLPRLERLLEQGSAGPLQLLAQLAVQEMPVEQYPCMRLGPRSTWFNVNAPEELTEALAILAALKR